MQSTQPDIYLLLGDCLRAADADAETMPFTRDWCDTECTRVYSPSTWTLASYASLYSLRLPLRHGVTRRGDAIRDEQARLPEALRAAGYRTALFSENPTYSSQTGFHHGIDYVDDSIQVKPFRTDYSALQYVTGLNVESVGSAVKSILEHRHRAKNAANLLYGAYKQIASPDYQRHPHHGERVISHLVDYLSESSGPQFCSINLLDTHNPHYALPPNGGEYVDGDVSPETMRALFSVTDDRLFFRDDPPVVPEEVEDTFASWEEIHDARRSVYRSQAREVDALVERFVNETSKASLEDALVVVAGDHGQLFGEEGMTGHQTCLHPGGVQVPCHVSFPNAWEASETGTYDEPLSLLGVAKTLTDVAAGEIDSADEFLRAARRESYVDGEIVVCADGPTWDRETLANVGTPKEDRLAARRIGYVRGDTFVEFYCPWKSTDVERREYGLAADTRVLRDTRDAEPENAEHARWLQSSPDESGLSSEASQRLQQLGYI